MTTKAKNNCWTCKERKVGCDKALPECANCTRSKRTCKGYGLKLARPDKADGRRKQKKYQADPETSATRYLADEDGRLVFLNTTFDDVMGRRTTWEQLLTRERHRGVARSLYVHGVLGSSSAELLTYYDSVVARMITTIDDNTNGFRRDLIPMALSSSDTSSKSLLQATLALASFHLGREQDALKHKSAAISLLSNSIQSPYQNKMAQFATCMMLCVYSVFDSSDTTWNMHLQGAKGVLDAFSPLDRSNPSLTFMIHWLQYHDVFSAYSHPVNPSLASRSGSNPPRMPTIVLPPSTESNKQIIGLLGCSSELLHLISCINQIRTWLQSTHPSSTSSPPRSKSPSPTSSSSSSSSTPKPPDRASALPPLLQIRKRILNLTQTVHISPDSTSGPISTSRITLTADLYRVATLLYLFQVAALLPSSHTQNMAAFTTVPSAFAPPISTSLSDSDSDSDSYTFPASAPTWTFFTDGAATSSSSPPPPPPPPPSSPPPCKDTEDAPDLLALATTHGLALLAKLPVCTSPWPLFVLACSVTSDADRVAMVRAIEAGARERRVGNYDVVGRLVGAVWRRQDLRATGGGGVVDWRDIIEGGGGVPSFI